MSLRIAMAACVFRSVEMLAVARACGFDVLIADMEHGSMSLGEVATLCVAGIEAGFPVHVRVPGVRSDDLSRVVDCGASAVIIPHVDSVEEARLIVEKTRFAPLGRRSIPSPLAVASFRPQSVDVLVAQAERSFDVFVMIESREGLAVVELIAALEGIDGLIIGANDLADSLGHRGDLAHPDILTAFVQIAGAAKQSGRMLGVMGLPPTLLRSHALDLGAAYVLAANDINLIHDAGAARVAEVRSIAAAPAAQSRMEN
jgi:2-keto-3-deoxy-L-rhamnonate aldolase RhmA